MENPVYKTKIIYNTLIKMYKTVNSGLNREKIDL